MHGLDGTNGPVDCGRDLAGDQQDRVPRIISEAICCGVLMSGRKLAIPSTDFNLLVNGGIGSGNAGPVCAGPDARQPGLLSMRPAEYLARCSCAFSQATPAVESLL